MKTIDIHAPCARAGAEARARWARITGSVGSLGALEDAIVKVAALTGDANIDLTRRALVVFCADNGVIAKGITHSAPGETRLLAEKIAAGEGISSAMARKFACDEYAADIGMLGKSADARIIDCRVLPGTGDITEGPAMTRAQAEEAIERGIGVAREMKARGYRLLLTGELGIGNTTTTAAVISSLLELAPESVTGRGAGISDAGFERKLAAVRRALDVNRPDPDDPLDTLSKVGGLDIAGLTGFFIGGAAERLPLIVDGFTAACAALIATLLCPGVENALLPGNLSGEPGDAFIARALKLTPIVDARLALGEGTGALCALPLYDAALAVYHMTNDC